ncbi:hypothetical protein HanIR_Chr01g0033541 [Helianthus annuus]|nr:hypothetical protein HanIR_Chr01g0033541 [Helianthus annuus]
MAHLDYLPYKYPPSSLYVSFPLPYDTVVNQGRLIHWSRQVGLIPSFRGSVAGPSAGLSPAQGKHTLTCNKEDGVGVLLVTTLRRENQ